MKNKYLIIILLTALVFTNCAKEEKKIDRSIPIPKESYIVPLNDHFLDRDLSNFVKIQDQKLELKITIDSTKKPFYTYVLNTEVKVDFNTSKVFNSKTFRPAFDLLFLNKHNEIIHHDFSSGYMDHNEVRKLLGKAKGDIKIPIKFFSSEIKFDPLLSEQAIINSQEKAFKIIFQLEEIKIASLECEIFIQDDAKAQIIKKENENTQDENKTLDTGLGEEETDDTNLSDCEVFLKGYEKFVIDYIKLSKKLNTNPTDPQLIVKVIELNVEATKWTSKITACQSNPTFYLKYIELYTSLLSAMSGDIPNDSEAVNTNLDEEKTNDSNLSDCEMFLKDYEKFVIDYVKLSKEIKNNPTDPLLMTKIFEFNEEVTKWTSQITACQNDPTFYQKYIKLYTSLLEAM